MAWQCKHSLFLLCNQPATRKECAVDVVNKLFDMVIHSYVMRSIARPLITEMAMMDLSHKDMFLSDFFQKLNESKSIRELLLHLSSDENLDLEKSKYESHERQDMSEMVADFKTPFVLEKSQIYRVNESEVIRDEANNLYKDDHCINQDEEHEVRLKTPKDFQLENDEMHILSNLLNNLKIEEGSENNDKVNETILVSVGTVMSDLSDLKNRKSILQSELNLNQLENNKEINNLKKITNGLNFTNLNSLQNQGGQNIDSDLVLTEYSMAKTLETELARDKNKTMNLVDYPVREDQIIHTHLDGKSLFLPDNTPPIFHAKMTGENNVDTNNCPYHLTEFCIHPTMSPKNNEFDAYADFKMPNAVLDCAERKYILQSQTVTSSHDSTLLLLSDNILNPHPTDLSNGQVDLDDDHFNNIENAIKLSEIFSDLFFNSPLQSVIRDQITVNCDSILERSLSLESEPRDFNDVNILESAITGIIINTKELENKIKKMETQTKNEHPLVHFTATVSSERDQNESETIKGNEIGNVKIQSDRAFENHTLNHKLNNGGIKSVIELENKETLEILDYNLVNNIQIEPSNMEDIFKKNTPSKFDKRHDDENPNYISTSFDRRCESVEDEWEQFLKGIDILEHSIDIATPGVISIPKVDVIVENIISENQSSYKRSWTAAKQYGNDSAANPNSNSNMEEGHHLYVHLNPLIDKINTDNENSNSKDSLIRKESSNTKFVCLDGRNNATPDKGILERNTGNVLDSDSTSMTESIFLKRNTFRTQILKNHIEDCKNSKEVLIGNQSSSFDANNIPICAVWSTHNLKDSIKVTNKFHVNLDDSTKNTNLNAEISNMIDIFMGKESKIGPLICTETNEYLKLDKMTYESNVDNDNDTSCESNYANDCSKTSSLTKERKMDYSENKLVDVFYKEENTNDRGCIETDYLNDGFKMFSDSNIEVNLARKKDSVNDGTEVSVTCVSQTDILLRDFTKKPKSLNCMKKEFNDTRASLKPSGIVGVNNDICETLNPIKSINPKLDNTVLVTNIQRCKRSDVVMEDKNGIFVYFDPFTGKENRNLEQDTFPESIIFKESSCIDSVGTKNPVYQQSNQTCSECKLDVSNSINKSSSLMGNNKDISNGYIFVDKMDDNASLSSEKKPISNLKFRGKSIRPECDLKKPFSIKNKNAKTKQKEKSENQIGNLLLVVEVSNNSSGSCDLSGGRLSKENEKQVIYDSSIKRINGDGQKNSKNQSFAKRSVSNKSSDSSVLENLSDLFFNAEESLWKNDEKNLKANELKINIMVKSETCLTNDTQSLPYVDIIYETKDEDILPCETVESIPVTESYGLFPNIIDNILPVEDRNCLNDSIYGIINENINEIQSSTVSLESTDAKQTDKEDTDKVYEKLLNNESDYITYTNELNLNFDISRSNIIKTENLYIRKSLLDVFFENEGLDIITKNESIHLFALEETKIVDRIYEKRKSPDPSQSKTISTRDSENESLNKREDKYSMYMRENYQKNKKELKEYSDTKKKDKENQNGSLKDVVNENRIQKDDDFFENDARLKKLQLSQYISQIVIRSPYFVLVNGRADNFCSWVRYPQSTLNNENLSLSEISLAKSYFFNFCWKNVIKDRKKNSNILYLKSKNDFDETFEKSRLKCVRSIHRMRSIEPNESDPRKGSDSSNSSLKIIANPDDKQSSKMKRFVKSGNEITSFETQISNREIVFDNVEHGNSKEQEIASSKLNYVTIMFVWCLSGGICVLSFLYSIFLLMDGERVQEHWT